MKSAMSLAIASHHGCYIIFQSSDNWGLGEEDVDNYNTQKAGCELLVGIAQMIGFDGIDDSQQGQHGCWSDIVASPRVLRARCTSAIKLNCMVAMYREEAAEGRFVVGI